jgi:hypothetical protein
VENLHLEEWKIGMMGHWDEGMREYWKNGVMEVWRGKILFKEISRVDEITISLSRDDKVKIPPAALTPISSVQNLQP